MKRINLKLYVIIAMLFMSLFGMSIAVTAQEFQKKETKSFVFDVESGSETSEVFTFESDVYPIFITKTTGSKYIKAISFEGRTYPVWIFEDTGKTFEGKKVYVTKKGKYCIYQMNKQNYPYPNFNIERTNN